MNDSMSIRKMLIIGAIGVFVAAQIQISLTPVTLLQRLGFGLIVSAVWLVAMLIVWFVIEYL